MNTDLGETTTQCIELLGKSLESWMNQNDDIKLNEISKRVDSLWLFVFDISNEVAPPRKFALAEQLVNCPEVMKRLLFVFPNCEDDVKRKIRDLLRFLDTWASNDSPYSSIPRKQNSRSPAKFNALLFKARFESFLLVKEGRDGPESVRLFNDIIRIFAKDHDCLTAILNDKGLNSKGTQTRDDGCVWKLFDRLLEVQSNRGFHVYAAFFETIEILFLSDHLAVHEFLMANLARFIQTFHKLISINNFFIQAKSLKFIGEILSNREHRSIREHWLEDPNLIKFVCLAIQSESKPVRKEAAALLNIFVMNPDNSTSVHLFLSRNRNLLIDYCLSRINFPECLKEGEIEEWIFAEVAYNFITRNFNSVTPNSPKDTKIYFHFQRFYEDFLKVPERSLPGYMEGFNVSESRHKVNMMRPYEQTPSCDYSKCRRE